MRKEEKIKSILENLLAKHDSYHHHKENTSHAGIILQVTLFSGLITFSDISLIRNINSTLIIASVSIIWFLLHIFIRNQLRLKRVAGINYAGCFNAYLEFVNSKFKNIELKPKAIEGFKTPKYFIFLDNFFPMATATFKTDMHGKDNKYPGFIADNIQRKYDYFKVSNTRYEWIFAIVSFAMFAIIIWTILNQ